MSRRFRLEEERAQQLTQELQEEEDKLKLQKEKIFAPIVWHRLECGIKIQDLHPNFYDQVLQMIEESYIKEDVIFRNTDIAKDELSLNSFREKLLYSMRDRSSIVAIDEENSDAVAGVLILKAVKKYDFGRVFSRVFLTAGESFQNILEFFNYINRYVDVFDHFDCDVYLQYYLLCIDPNYRGKRLGFQMMETGVAIAKHLNIAVVTGIFDCYNLQKLASKIGMEVIYELNYISWSGRLKFCDLGAGNYTCAFMGGRLTERETPEEEEDSNETASTSQDPKEDDKKLTRVEKRRLKKKNNNNSNNGN